jgi:hypothetical protein
MKRRKRKLEFVQGMKEMKSLSHRLKKGPLEVQEYGRQQLQGMLSVGPYSYLQVPTPSCSARISDENSGHIIEWKRAAVKDFEVAVLKVWLYNAVRMSVRWTTTSHS